MAEVLPDVIQLKDGETLSLFTLESRPAVAQQKRMSILGESILSSVFLKSSSPGMSLDVKYFDTTTGTNPEDGERFDLNGHITLTDADVGETNRILVSRIHNKPICEVTVTGAGTMEFGVYVSVRSEVAADLTLYKDGDVVEILEDQGQPVMCYDEDAGTFNFIRCKDGGLPVVPPEGIGTPFYLRGGITVAPGTTQNMISFTVSGGTVRKIHKVNISASNDGYFSLESGAVEIASGIIDTTNRNVSFTFDPPRPIAAGVLVELKYLSESEPSLGCQATGYISGEDFT